MPWWSWVLIWGGLIALLIALLIVGAIWLLRKLETVVAELDRLEEITTQLRQQLEANPIPRAQPNRLALLRDYAAVRADRKAYLQERSERRAARHEAKLRRARNLLETDPNRYQHLVDPTMKG